MKRTKKKKKYIKSKKYRRIKKKVLKFIYSLVFLLIILILSLIVKKIFFKQIIVKDIKFDDNIITITLNDKIKYDTYYMLSNDTPNIDDEDFKKIENNCISFEYDNNKRNIYIKNKKEIIYTSENEIMFANHDININDKLYLANDNEYKYLYNFFGNIKNLNIKYDNNIIKINNDGNIITLNEGNTSINFVYNEKEYNTDIIVTNLITKIPTEFDYSKKELQCNTFTKEENDLIDEILKNRIENVGYKTRAGAVEAARFLTLEFPYRINYFYENGRQTTNKVDGEGRYYHIGLYLDSSRSDNLTGSSTGPAAWGCSIYSNPAKRKMNNGLDCSGFVSWVLLNAGFDVKDVGAGFSNNLDLTDYGKLKSLNNSLLSSGDIKAGDLLHSYHAGGHIGIIVGITDKNYYVAQAIWNDASVTLANMKEIDMGVQITKYTYSELLKAFPHVVLMDEYYKNDGEYTKMW